MANTKFFPNEINKNVEHKSSCSVLALVLVLASVLLTIVLGLLYLKFHKSFVVDLAPNMDKNMTLLEKLNKQIDDQSGEELITITITENDINKLLTSYSDFPLKDPSATIKAGGLILKGKTGFLNIETLIMPKAEKGKLIYEIKDIKAAGVPAPQKVADPLKGQLSNFISSRMPNNKQVYIENVVTSAGAIQAVGKKR